MHGEYPSIDGRHGARQAAKSLIWTNELGEYREVDRATGRIIRVTPVARGDKRETTATGMVKTFSRWANGSAAVADTAESRWGSKPDAPSGTASRWVSKPTGRSRWGR